MATTLDEARLGSDGPSGCVPGPSTVDAIWGPLCAEFGIPRLPEAARAYRLDEAVRDGRIVVVATPVSLVVDRPLDTAHTLAAAEESLRALARDVACALGAAEAPPIGSRRGADDPHFTKAIDDEGRIVPGRVMAWAQVLDYEASAEDDEAATEA